MSCSQLRRTWQNSLSEPRAPWPSAPVGTAAAPPTGDRDTVLPFGREMHFRNMFPKNVAKGFISNKRKIIK